MFGVRRGSELTLHKRIVREFPLMYRQSTDTIRLWIAFGCSPNVRHTAECCLPHLTNTSTSNVRIIFECRVRICILFAFRCKRGLKHINLWSPFAPLLREVDMCARWLFCMKFNAQQFLFKAIFNIIGNFGSIEP